MGNTWESSAFECCSSTLTTSPADKAKIFIAQLVFECEYQWKLKSFIISRLPTHCTYLVKALSAVDSWLLKVISRMIGSTLPHLVSPLRQISRSQFLSCGTTVLGYRNAQGQWDKPAALKSHKNVDFRCISSRMGSNISSLHLNLIF